MKKVLLHCCCAPCSVSVVSNLRKDKIEFDMFWYNPNIKPEDEYNKRLKCLIKFTDDENLNLIRGNSCRTEGTRSRANSCESCYRARLEKTAEYASLNGYEAFTTTLLISPYQNHEAVKRIGEEAAQEYGVSFLYRDFRPLFREGQRHARARGFYMQKYCGCGKSGIRDQGSGISSYVSNQIIGTTRFDSDQQTDPRTLTPDPQDIFQRLELLIGNDNLQKLHKTRVIIFGAGGVGSWCAEALARSGIGKLDIVDFDKVEPSNLNRQLQATAKTIGMSKVDVLKERLLEINSGCGVISHNTLFNKENADSFIFSNFDFVIDAIDILHNKLDLIETACNAGVSLFSSMGMALKTDPSKIKTASIWKTDVCPLARLVRQGLRKRNFKGDFKVVYSDERRIFTTEDTENTENGKRINGSIVTVTATAGLLLANLVIQDKLK